MAKIIYFFLSNYFIARKQQRIVYKYVVDFHAFAEYY